MKTSLILGSASAMLFAGCASLTTLQTARTLEPGDTVYEFGAAGSTDLGRDLFLRGTNLGPQLLAGARRGVSDGFDVGYRMWLLGMSADAKVRLLESDDYALAIAPGLGAEKTYAFYGLDLYLPLLMEKTLTEDIDLYVSPKAIARVSLGHGSELDLAAGASVGLSVWVNENFSVLPELTAMWPSVKGDDPCGLQLGPVSASCMRPGAPIVAAAIGLQYRR